MSWRTVVITGHTKLYYKNQYLVIRGEELNMVHLSEIQVLIVESTMVSITSSLLSELVKNKIKVIFCDEKHNPLSEVVPYYGAHNTSKKTLIQIEWDEQYKKTLWTDIIRQKILNQASLLHKLGIQKAEMLYDYAQELEFFDTTNREGHAAKVYFNSLFGKGFCRDNVDEINAALDYGYSIILSCFNREIVASGYLTQIGIKHVNEYNQFNLSSDFMEPFRIVVDEYVYKNIGKPFDTQYKYDLLELLNLRVKLESKEYFLTNAIQQYVKKILAALESKDLNKILLFQYP